MHDTNRQHILFQIKHPTALGLEVGQEIQVLVFNLLDLKM